MTTIPLSFSGFVNIPIYSRQSTWLPNLPPRNPIGPAVGPWIDTVNFGEKIVTWNDPQPTVQISNITLNQLVQTLNSTNATVNLVMTPIFQFTSGEQGYNFDNVPTTNLSFFPNGPLDPSNDVYIQAVKNLNGIGFYNGQKAPLSPISLQDIGNVMTIFAWFWNAGGNCAASCANYQYPMTLLKLSIFLDIQLSLTFTDSQLNNSFILDYCTSTIQNQISCYTQAYRQYCLIQKNENNDINIFGSTGCFTFFSDYIQGAGPSQDIDNLLTPACSAKIPGVDTFESQAITDQERSVCACHLDPQIYSNLQKGLQAEFPGSILVAEIGQCLFSPCVDSNFKTVLTGKQCALPACVNIAEINNNGTIKGSSNIIQNDENCANLAKKGSADGNGNGKGNETTEIKSWIEKYWIWLVVGIGLLVALIIIILVVLAGESNKKKKTKIITTK